jgi:hypothetical protein
MAIIDLYRSTDSAGRHVLRRAFHEYLLATIRSEQGEWTVGRAKPVFRRFWQSHNYRATIRRHLTRLAEQGHLLRHGDGTPRIYYTYRTEADR